MKSMHLLLDEAEQMWRGQVKQDFALRGDTPVVRESTPTGTDWLFYTDLKTVFANISGDEDLQRKFTDIVTKYWEGDPQELARSVLHYLLFHELYHPIEAPFSVSGETNDNKLIHQAIRRGLLRAQPKLNALEQIVKVQASQNGVKDFVLDNRLFLDNKDRQYFRSDVIPIWDLLELNGEKAKTNFYTTTRLLYGLLYGPEATHEFFEEKAGNDGIRLAEQSISALLQKKVQLPKKSKGLVSSLTSMLELSKDESEVRKRLGEYPRTIRRVFAGSDRYDGIERFMAVLGPYVEAGMPQARPDMQGEDVGASLQNILEDLLDDMKPEEQVQFVQELQELKPKDPQVKDIDLFAQHEFYKRNHPEVTIVGGGKEGQSVIVGKRQYWDLKRTTVLTEDQLGRLDLKKIEMLQRKTRLPWLVDLGNGTLTLNQYELKERELKDIVYIEKDLDVPDVTEFYLDRSSSMFGGKPEEFKLNDGNRWDMLGHVVYGFAHALLQGSQKVRKPAYVRFHSFGETQVDSPLIPIEQFWNGDSDLVQTLFRPENGYGATNMDLKVQNDQKKRAYVIATDGKLSKGLTGREANKMKKLARTPNNSVVLFEIGGTYRLGNAVSGHQGISYHQVHNKNEMLKAGLEVLLSR